MKNIYKGLLLSLLSILVIAGCSSNESNGSGNSRQELRFPTAGTTGTIYPLGASMANIWNNQVDDVRVTAQASNGGVDNLNMMKDGEAQITFATAGIVWEAFNGENTFEGRQYEDVRVIAGLYYNPNQFVVREDSGIESIADIKGKNFVPGAVGSTPEVESSIILPEYGINYPNDIKETYVGFTEAIDLMRNRQVDGAIIQAGLPTAAVTEMTSTAGGKLIGIEEDIRNSLKDQYPWYAEVTIPAGTYDNQPEDVETLGIKMLLLVDASVSDETVYELTKTFWENLEELEKTHSIVQQMKLEEAVTELADIPLHPGSEKYYQEQGVLE
ncbi:TAXI family TRAP transporter solute-binding subunit [Bacillus sp. B15-48]|uniref:TAXI family TRAP transporter solute-binding subunit n=1 Tax=Bacillus sp. B15-48 TaxID=1548601 RepID=UPI00193F00B7|nr:TAXI family TRAP transporter solute-binding subunit [Bacillus sp. B15-48]MBM4763137.1 TAXI family TRAP transporter solute-binding subunit [Bacillus sp. B15-48]